MESLMSFMLVCELIVFAAGCAITLFMLWYYFAYVLRDKDDTYGIFSYLGFVPMYVLSRIYVKRFLFCWVLFIIACIAMALVKDFQISKWVFLGVAVGPAFAGAFTWKKISFFRVVICLVFLTGFIHQLIF
jgi:hypothetical protein